MLQLSRRPTKLFAEKALRLSCLNQQVIAKSFSSRADNFKSEGDLFKWIRTKDRGDISKSVNVRYLPEVGYDLFASGDIPNNTIIVSISKAAWEPFSADHATREIEKTHPTLFRSILATTNAILPSQSRETSNLIRSCCMSLQLLQYVQSHQNQYASLLSSISFPWNNAATPHPVLMNKDELIDPYLGMTKLKKDISKRHGFYSLFISKLLQDGDSLAYLISHNFFAHKPDSPDPISQYLWAIGLVLSRGLSSPNSPLSLVPFLDFANHTNPIATNCNHRFDSVKQTFELVTSRDVKAAESLRISYGEARSTESFMILYGFTGFDIHIKRPPSKLETASVPTEKDPIREFPVNPNDVLTMSIPVHIVPGRSHIPNDTISAEDFFEIFQGIPPLILGDITEDIVLLYEHIQVQLSRNHDTSSAAKQCCEITFPIHLLSGPSSISTWTTAASKNFTLPPSVNTEAEYITQCISVIVDVLLRTRKVSSIVAGEGDSLSALNITKADVTSLQKDLQHRIQQLLSPQICNTYNLSSTMTTREALQHLQRLVSETPLPSSSTSLAPHYYWRQNCAFYLRQQLFALYTLEQECDRLFDMLEESLAVPTKLK